jgi:hypothetical protein
MRLCANSQTYSPPAKKSQRQFFFAGFTAKVAALQEYFA